MIDVVCAVSGRESQRRHVRRIRKRLRSDELPRRDLPEIDRLPTRHSHHRNSIGAHCAHTVLNWGDEHISGRVTTAFTPAAVDHAHRTLRRVTPLRSRRIDGRMPCREVGCRKVQRLGRLAQPGQVHVDDPSPPAAHENGFEGAVASQRRKVVGTQQRLVRVTYDAIQGYKHSISHVTQRIGAVRLRARSYYGRCGSIPDRNTRRRRRRAGIIR